MVDPTANNHRLGSTDPRDFISELGIRTWMQFEKTPIFDELENTFWVNRFSSMSFSELRILAGTLGLPRRRTKTDQVRMLCDYFKAEV